MKRFVPVLGIRQLKTSLNTISLLYLLRHAVKIILLAGIVTLYSNFLFKPSSVSSQNVAVVELFTSEGCSSCPAADDLIKEMAAIREREGKPFIALSFHITYWNHIGWIDSFSNEFYTERQKKYIKILALPNLYTPQAIMNGELEFVGSNPIAFRNALVEKEDIQPTYSISASALHNGDTIVVNYSLDHEPKNELVNIAIIEKEAKRKVTRGENKSRTLKHYNVVREFKVIESKKHDTISLHTVEGLSDDNMEVVIYIQHKRSMKILSASKFPLSHSLLAK